MAWKILLPQEIMEEGRKLLEDAGHTIIEGRGFETEDVLADMKEYQPDAMIVRITPITREVVESNPNLKVIVRHGAGFDALDVKACHDNGVQALYAPVANSTSVAETALLLDVAEGLKDSIPCTACRYCCAGCPQELDIPMLLGLYNDLRYAPSMIASMRAEAVPEDKRASACIGCGRCAQICPQRINIPQMMQDFTAALAKLPSWAEICRQRDAAQPR